jgi:four helix bundle protein
MNNVAEGFERGTNPDLRRFLFMAKGSAGEVRSLLSMAYELKYIDQNDYNALNDLAISVSKLLSSFIKSIR